MRNPLKILLITCSALLLLACQGEKDQSGPFSNNQEPQVLADTFFFGCAYLDENNNGELDENDPPIGEMTFSIALNGGGGFGGRTSGSGCTTVVIPGGLADDHWPVRARMQPPEGSGYELLGSEEITLERLETHADFLFRLP